MTKERDKIDSILMSCKSFVTLSRQGCLSMEMNVTKIRASILKVIEIPLTGMWCGVGTNVLM